MYRPAVVAASANLLLQQVNLPYLIVMNMDRGHSAIRRFRIDQSTQWQRVKVTTRSEFPLLIDMEGFVEPSLSGLNTSADEGTSLETLKGHTISLAEAASAAMRWANTLYEIFGESSANFLRLNDSSIDRNADLDAYYDTVRGDMTKMRLETSGQLRYQLHAVVMHCGSAYSGHYFAYIRDSLREGNWTL
jgi:ubiquitin C-terminal hydrolase